MALVDKLTAQLAASERQNAILRAENDGLKYALLHRPDYRLTPFEALEAFPSDVIAAAFAHGTPYRQASAPRVTMPPPGHRTCRYCEQRITDRKGCASYCGDRACVLRYREERNAYNREKSRRRAQLRRRAALGLPVVRRIMAFADAERFVREMRA